MYTLVSGARMLASAAHVLVSGVDAVVSVAHASVTGARVFVLASGGHPLEHAFVTDGPQSCLMRRLWYPVGPL